MDRETVEVYERLAGTYRDRRRSDTTAAAAFAGALPPGAVRADLGCGPGLQTAALGGPLVSLDAAFAMVREVPSGWRVQGDLADLPLRGGCLGGAWASKCYQHLPHDDLPLALADLHRVTVVGAPVVLTLFAGAGTQVADDDLPGRRFSLWPTDRLLDVVVGAGFAPEHVEETPGTWAQLRVHARRLRTLPDTVGAGMRLLLCGLNPSCYAADRGIGFARPGNRYWPALRAAGLTSTDGDIRRLLRHDRLGMTDLVKRATVSAAELDPAEYAAGLERVERLCAWLRPTAVYFVGLAGWRAVVEGKATTGWQERTLGGVPVYLGPSTSGLNASTQLGGHVAHLRAATGQR